MRDGRGCQGGEMDEDEEWGRLEDGSMSTTAAGFTRSVKMRVAETSA